MSATIARNLHPCGDAATDKIERRLHLCNKDVGGEGPVEMDRRGTIGFRNGKVVTFQQYTDTAQWARLMP